MKKIFVTIALLLSAMTPFSVSARDSSQILDWYINDFHSRITVNQDSSLDIAERITADCGDLPDKHGIFRVIPYVSYGDNGQRFETPITLESITNQDGVKYDFTQTKDTQDKTISYKIGSPNQTVKGENIYIIKYHVENAIRFGNDKFDELYWNLSGNFWQLEIDSFSAEIIFPEQFDSSKAEVNVYTGDFESNTISNSYSWQSNNLLSITPSDPLSIGEGITLSITQPKGLFKPYVAPFYVRFSWLWLIFLPLLFYYFCYKIWQKNGRDPRINPTVAPEFEIPENLSPLDMGMLQNDGRIDNKFLTASIVNLAVKGKIKIEKIESSGLLKSKDYKLIKTEQTLDGVSPSEKKLFDRLFGNNNEILTSSLKNKFYIEIPRIQNSSMDYLVNKNWLIRSSRYWQTGFIVAAIVQFVLGIFCMNFGKYFGYSLMISALIVFVFSFLMTKRSEEGAKLHKRILGFRLYMSKAEKFRQQFNEKENIFEAYLPYAIMFGITGLWIKQIKSIYGEEYVNNYHPLWYVGVGQMFDFNSFSNDMQSLSSNIGNTLSSSPSSSGSGGGGFSGGGGGGGGGGGW
ncbi:MAG: hypothetical protein BWY19_00648 [bacterium ADurb.Bin212]|nr:MAG: hypothetical protein BWY19_00648 [bacterium ADurb.Bin212]